MLRLVERLLDGEEALDLPVLAANIVITVAAQVRNLQARLGDLDKDLMAWFRGNDVARRLETIPGIGVITASALAATVTDPHQFTSGRQFAAWLRKVCHPARSSKTTACADAALGTDGAEKIGILEALALWGLGLKLA